MPQTVPLRNDLPFFDLQAQLDGVTYTLELRWNTRLLAWFLSVYDQEGVVLLLAGVRLVASVPLAAYFTGRQPPGSFVVIDTSGAGADPGLTDLGQRCKLVYATAAELGLV